jgi:ribosomal protein S12 methylthiotransferase accessory factor
VRGALQRPAPTGAGREGGTLLGLWEQLVDPRVGIVREVRELPVDEDEPNFFHYLSTACDTTAFGALPNFANNGGVATTRRGAIAKAVGEGVERYCAAIFDEEGLALASWDELDGPAVEPESFALFSAAQHAAPKFPWVPFTRDVRTRWTLGTSLVRGEDLLVPAATVYVPYHYRLRLGDTPVIQPISTGLACGSCWADAALGGLCEAIERDAFTITWQARLSRPRVPREGLPAAAEDRVRRFEAVGLRVEIVDITTDIGCPVLLTVAIGSAPTSPAIAIAAAAHPSWEVALVKSLEELAHTRKFAAQLMDYTPEVALDVAAGHPEVKGQHEHLRIFCGQEAIERAAFLWAGDEVPLAPAGPLPDTARSLREVAAGVAAAGLDPISCDLTTADVRELGLCVVRVVVPGLHPLAMGHANRALGGHRLYEVPGRLGLDGPAPGEPDNPYPHPFP